MEAVRADAMGRSLREGQRVTLESPDQFAEGAAVERVGEETFRLADELVDDMIVVTQDEICAAVQDGFEDARAILEPAGALAIAGLKKWAKANGVRGESLVAVTSGANCTFDRLRLLAERALLGQRAEALLATRVPDTPGALQRVHNALAGRPVTELIYRSSATHSAGQATIFVSVGLADEGLGGSDGEVGKVIDSLKAAGIAAHDMSDNELAKSHMRYMSGGVKPVDGELLYRFDFPEQPGALKKFLAMCVFSGDTARQPRAAPIAQVAAARAAAFRSPLSLPRRSRVRRARFTRQPTWNLTLLHYRYRGAEVSKVLTGIQVPKGHEQQLRDFLKELGYAYVDETNNLVYELYCD